DESFAPGWRARIDGSSAPLLRADYVLQAVSVPPGDHLVEFTYCPVSFAVGLLVTTITAFLVALLSGSLLLQRSESVKR
ncbi:MAG: YfhO family protein, partial [bacterium]